MQRFMKKPSRKSVSLRVYVERNQRQALLKRASRNGTSITDEVRRAIGAYLALRGPDTLTVLDEGTRRAERHIEHMVAELDRLNACLDVSFAQLSHNAGRKQVRRRPRRLLN